MQTLMDEVHFAEGGSVVRMRKQSNAGQRNEGNQNDANFAGIIVAIGPLGLVLSLSVQARQPALFAVWYSRPNRSVG
jgi:hypothetical protein